MIPDYRKDATIVYRFTTRDAEGEPTTLSGSPTIAVYKEGSTSEVTTGLTLTADYDGVTGLNQIAIVTTDAFYEADKDYAIVLTAGTVDSVAVSGEVVHQFSLEKQTIADVSGLSTFDASSDKVTVESIDTNAIDAPSISSAAVNKIQADLSTLTAAGVWAHNTRTLSSFGTLVSDTAAAVWALATSALTATGTIGKLLVDNVNATISSRLATDSYTAPDNATIATISTRTARVDALIEDSSGDRFTAKALESAPAGAGLDAEQTRAALGLAEANLDTQLGDIATAVGDIGAGEGDYTITVAVDDGDDAIEGARVTAIQNGVQQAVGVTNSDGEAVIALDAGTYTFTVSAGGFLSAVTTHTVTAVSSTHEVPVSLTGITISPSQPGNITVFFTVFKDGLPAPGVAIPVQLKSTTNIGGFATQPQTVITDGNGVGQLVDALTDTTYSIRGVDFTTPSSGASFEVPTPFYL